MDFIKKHYEKLILSVVLLGVVVALVALPFVISADRQQIEDIISSLTNPKVAPLPPLELTPQNTVLSRLQNPPDLDFATTNKVFNPMTWKKNASGDIIKITTGHEVDGSATTVLKITPLYLILSFDNVETNAETRYVIGIERQFATSKSLRHQTRVASVGEKKELFTITKVNGDPVAPDELLLKLTDTGETVTISKGKPFQRADDYVADLRYEPEKKSILNRRVGAIINLNGEDYKLVAIHANEVILSAQSNQKKTILQYSH